MIEINLLPGGAGKKKGRSARGASFDMRSSLSGLSARVKDPYLAGAVASIVVAALIVGYLYTAQNSRQETLAAAEEQAVSDSTRFANYTKQRRRAEATRDTVLRQINIIRAIDGDRYLWPHLLDEVSRALPQYTWLTALQVTGTLQGAATPTIIGDSVPARPKPDAKPNAASIDTTVVRDQVRFAIEGQTVDLEAITRFMRQLEASPFLGDVELMKSQLTLVDGKEVSTFTLQANYVRQEGDLIQRVPLRAPTATPLEAAGN